MSYHWGKKEWIEQFWLNLKPCPEPFSLRQIFYKHLPEIERFVSSRGRDKNSRWADYFYIDMSRILSDLVLNGNLSYRDLNIFEGGGRENYVWQHYRYVEPRPPIEDCWVEYPLEVWVENNATFSSLEPPAETKIPPIHEYPCKINVVSMRGFQSTQLIEDAYLNREDEIEVILCLTDFDPSGIWMPTDLQNRFDRIGMNVDVIHIGLFPDMVPEERRATTLIHYKKRDPRTKLFIEKYGPDQLAYELQALTPSELRKWVRAFINVEVKQRGWVKWESANHA